MANGVTSEWEDIQVKLGNYTEKPKEIHQYEYTKEAMEKLENYDPNAHKNLNELDELEDELDEKIFEEYKQKKLAELKKLSEKPQYGSVIEISRDEYLTHVTNANPESYVILHLYQSYLDKCKIINEIFERICTKHVFLKFVKIVATRCIEGFPDSKLPCIVIYKEGTMVSNITNVDQYLKKMNVKSFENFLNSQKVIKIEEEEDEEEQEINKIKEHIQGNKKKKLRDSDESDSDDGKEYTSNFKR